MLIRALLLYVGYATKPQFLIVGAQKAGTTALHSYLRANPRVVAGTTKEIGFFSPEAFAAWPQHPHYGVLCGGGDPLRPLVSRRKRAWYHSHFPLPYRLAGRIAFEATPEYLYVPEAAQRIHDYGPETKLIVLTREPASRALAAWNMYRNWGSYRPEVYAHLRETRSFAEAVDTELVELASGTAPREPGYVQRGLRDVDFGAGTIRFFEKGGKVIVKPLPDEYVEILDQAQGEGVWKSADDYLIPNRRPGAVKNRERSDKVIWETVKKVALRAGVEATVHALRAAFAVQFDEANPDQLIALKELMGHTRIETTLVYLRRKNRAKAMEAVRTLSWGGAGHFQFPPREEAARKKPPLSRGFAEEAHTGFEPVPPP